MSSAANVSGAEFGSEYRRRGRACAAVVQQAARSKAPQRRRASCDRMERAYTVAIVNRLPVYFISHGGGPWSYMDDPSRAAYANLEASLAAMPGEIGRTPAAVLMVSAHWEEAEFTLTSHPRPPMVYDYYGFPDFTYQIRYDAPGRPGAGGASEESARGGRYCRRGSIPNAASITARSRR